MGSDPDELLRRLKERLKNIKDHSADKKPTSTEGSRGSAGRVASNQGDDSEDSDRGSYKDSSYKKSDSRFKSSILPRKGSLLDYLAHSKPSLTGSIRKPVESGGSKKRIRASRGSGSPEGKKGLEAWLGGSHGGVGEKDFSVEPDAKRDAASYSGEKSLESRLAWNRLESSPAVNAAEEGSYEGGGSSETMKAETSEALHIRFDDIDSTDELEQVNISLDADYVDSVEGYLLDVRYDGGKGRAVLLIYDPNRKRLVKWVDRTGHRPYFLVDGMPEDLREKGADFSKYESFVQYDIVSKFHPILRRRVRVTKVVTADPLAVKSMREIAEKKGIRYWEADIKYHHNYIFDRLLIPGMKVKADTKVDVIFDVEYDAAADMIDKYFPDLDASAREIAISWVRMIESPPPIVPMAAFDIEVYSPSATHLPDPDKALYPIISIAIYTTDGRNRVMLLHRPDSAFDDEDHLPDDADIEIYDSERAMILDALRQLVSYPVILTFNGDQFDIPYVYNRLLALGVEPSKIPIEFHQDYVTFTTSLHVDMLKLFDIKALQAYAFGGRYREKSLDAIAKALLGESKVEIKVPPPELSMGKLVEYNAQDSRITLKLMTANNMLVWNLIVMIMRISKLGLEDITRSQISSWIKGLMYWEHRRRGWLIPSKSEIEEIIGSSGPKVEAVIKDKKYRGAIVLDPPQGIFFNVVVLDFASLYPSLIKQWNLSYETVNNPHCRGAKRRVPEVGHEVCMEFNGISSELVGLLRDFRVRIYKKKAKDKSLPPEERMWYDIAQSAMKVYINASYGVFGSEAFSLYSLQVAESVTALGRTILLSTLKKARELNLFIVYGDTDSLFIWDPPSHSLKEIIDYVEREFGLELEVDKTFRFVLFSGLKKNYLGVTQEGDVVIKGMVAKKSNTPEFIKREFASAVDILKKLEKPDDVALVLKALRAHVNEVYDKVKNRVYTLDEYAIRVMLSKDPSEYTKNTPQHVKAALMLKREGLQIGKGDVVSFIKTRDSVGVRPVALAKLSDVDVNKYLDYVKTAFEQMLQAFGVTWEEMSGVKKLDHLLKGGRKI